MTTNLVKTKQTKEKLIVQLNGSLSVQYIDQIHKELKKLEYKKPTIEFQVIKDNKIDLAFVQILISLKNSSLIKNQKIRIKGSLNDVQKSLILGSLPDINIAT